MKKIKAMKKRFDKKVYIITGTNSSIGRETAFYLGKEGAPMLSAMSMRPLSVIHSIYIY